MAFRMGRGVLLGILMLFQVLKSAVEEGVIIQI